jgi:AcrR family transcriptional regulator
MQLFAERGYAGASLRELARRVEMSQPSLYHYFDSKAHLVMQVIDLCASELSDPVTAYPLPARVVDLPASASASTRAFYSDPRYFVYVRFMFAVALEMPELRGAFQSLWFERLEVYVARQIAPMCEAEGADPHEVLMLLMVVMRATAMAFIEARLFSADDGPSAKTLEFIDFTVHAATERLEQMLAG